MTNHPDPDSHNTQPAGQPGPKNDQPDPADAPTILPTAQGATGHPTSEAATLPPPSATAGYSATEDATLPRSAMGQSPFGGSSPQSVKYFGDYELLSEIARGGMGVVYRARQVNLNRLVALKMILAGQLASDEDVKRFYTEAEAAAALEHAGIVPIFEIGQHNDQHFFSMGFVDGGSLADKIKDGPLPSKEAATYTKKVAEAIAYAHSKGVIHRDLKPANILLDRNDEPKVTDFGLARRTESNSDLTRTGAVMGTPSYMPPEQAAGRTDQVGPLADVYSLGAILYCLLTGRPPFQASNPLDTLMQVMEREPVSVTTLNPAVHRDLETICHKCLQKDPAKRYASAQEFADDLSRWLNGEPIQARAVSSSERAWRWVKRNPIVSGSIAATVVAILLGSVLSIAFGIIASREATKAKTAESSARAAEKQAEESREEAMREAQIAKEQRAMAESNLERAEVSNYVNLFTSATSAFSEGRYDKAWWLLKQCPPHLRGWEHRYLRSIYDNSRQTIRTFDSDIRDIYFSSDGKRLWTNTRKGPTPWDSVTGRKIDSDSKMVQMGSYFKVSPNGTKVFSSSQSWDSDKSVWSHQLVNLSSGISEVSFDCPNEICAAAFSPDESRLVTGLVNTVPETPQPTTISLETKTIRAPMILKVWDCTSGNEITTITSDFEPLRSWASGKRESRVNSIAFDSVGKHVLAAVHEDLNQENNVLSFDVETGERTLSLLLPSASRCKIFAAYCPDERFIVTGLKRLYTNDKPSVDSQVQLWNAKTGGFVKSFGDPNIWLESIAISPDNQILAIASENGQCVLWDIETGKQLQTLIGQQDSVRSLTFSPDGRRLAAYCSSGTITVWEAMDRSNPKSDANRPMFPEVTRIDSRHSYSSRLSYSSWGYGGWVFEQQEDRRFLHFWNAQNQQQTAVIDFPKDGAEPAISQFSRDGTKVATGCSENGKVRLWDLSTGEELVAMYFKDTTMTSREDGGLWLSPDAGYIVVKRNNDIKTTENGRSWTSWNDLLEFRPTFEGGVKWTVPLGKTVAFAKDSSDVIVVKHNRQADLYSLVDGQLKRSWKVQMSAEEVALSPDGSLAAIWNSDFVHIYNAKDGELRSVIRDKKFNVLNAIFSPDSKRIVTSSRLTIQFWDATTGQLLLTLPRINETPNAIVFSDDGSRIVSISETDPRGATFEIWDSGYDAENPMVISDEMIDNQKELPGAEPWPWPDDADQREYHLRNADKAEQDNHWFGAIWHLRRCLMEGSDSDLLRERIARLEAQMNSHQPGVDATNAP